MSGQHAGAVAPHLDQYFGAWALLPERFDALSQFAEQLNLQLHLEAHAPPAAGSADGRAANLAARRGEPRIVGATDPVDVAVIDLHGAMMKHVSSFSGGTSTALARRELRAAAKDPSIGGIMLHIDSPGGTVAGIEDLAAEIRAAAERKPVHAYIEDLGASAAYWAASQTARIATGPTAIVGSIGVFNVVHDLSGLAEKKGIKVHVVKFGAHKGGSTPGAVVTDQQLAEYQRLVDTFGAAFVDAVASGRQLTQARAKELADGRVHVGAAAKELGLVDAIENFDTALAALATAVRERDNQSKGSKVSQQPEGASPQAKSFEEMAKDRRAAIAAACPEASESFIDSQVLKGASPLEASTAYCRQLQAEKKAAEEKAAAAASDKAAADEAAKAKADADAKAEAEAKAKGKREPVKQLASDGDGGSGSGDAVAEWKAAVQAERDAAAKAGRPCDTLTATRRANAKNPGLREAAQAAGGPAK